MVLYQAFFLFAEKKMAAAKKKVSPVSFDEKLAEEVRKFPILYDKSSSDFKDKQKKDLAWKTVAQSIGLKTGKL